MFRAWLHGLAAAVPSRCSLCGRWPAEPVCGDCRARFARMRPRCLRCALPLPAGQACCGACISAPPPLDACHAAVPYAYPWAGLVTRFKFHQEPGWAGTFAALLRATPGVRQSLDEADAVLPMPLGAARLAERGFNQALEIARRLAPPGRLQPDALLRVRETSPQSALPLSGRLANVRGAFAVDPLRAGLLRRRRLVLVDDVMTSGASLHAAVGALKAAGAAHVTAVVLARTDEAAPSSH